MMARRVENIIPVLSIYDTFILQEDGQLGEFLLGEFLDLHLHQLGDSSGGRPVQCRAIRGGTPLHKDIKVTPSQGSHFFQNLTSFRRRGREQLQGLSDRPRRQGPERRGDGLVGSPGG